MKIPSFLKNEMRYSLRLHMENNLEMRIKFILKVITKQFGNNRQNSKISRISCGYAWTEIILWR